MLAPASALAALVAVHTVEDKRRGTAEGIAHAASVGLTTVADPGGLVYSDYTLIADLWRAGKLDIRFRQFFNPALNFPTLDGVKTFVANNHSNLGDDRFRLVGIGEALQIGGANAATTTEAAQFLGERGWTLILHTVTPAENRNHLDAFKVAAQSFDIAKLRWQLHHVNNMTPADLDEVAELGIGLGIQGALYNLNGFPSGVLPWRQAFDRGIPVGAGSDGTNVTHNPWLMLYFMVSGRDNSGQLINAAGSVTRLEALRMYTEGSAYLTRDDHQLGTIEEGKFADLAVLSANYLKVPEAKIKKITSDLTINGGRVVHAAGRFKHLK